MPMDRITATCKVGSIGLIAFAVFSAASPAADSAAVARGLYLVKAGDCAACHTAKGGKPFAGGRAMSTPFGTIYTTNITPDRQTGIGDWTQADFYRAMHSGIRRDGQHLYPAFPYPWFTKVTPSDVQDIKAYLDTVAPVQQQDRPPELLFRRGVMEAWNKLFFVEGAFVEDPGRSASWNRGAYLVRGLGHCAGCHTDKNFAGAPRKNKDLQGGPAEDAFAPSLAGDLREGLGNWSITDLVDYLKTGSNTHTAAGGPMSEVIVQSTQYLNEADLTAIAIYLKDLPPTEKEATDRVDAQAMARGQALYVDNCTGCHMEGGEGLASTFPALRGSSAVQARKADTLIQVLLAGDAIPSTRSKPTGLRMPAFDAKLDDGQAADVLTYIRNAWGNHAGAVSAANVGKLRTRKHQQGS